MTSRAERHIIDVFKFDPGSQQKPPIGVWQVEMPAAGSRSDRNLRVNSRHLSPTRNYLVADFVATGPDTWTDHRDHSFRSSSKLLDHGDDRSARSVGNGSSPARVNCANS